MEGGDDGASDSIVMYYNNYLKIQDSFSSFASVNMLKRKHTISYLCQLVLILYQLALDFLELFLDLLVLFLGILQLLLGFLSLNGKNIFITSESLN